MIVVLLFALVAATAAAPHNPEQTNSQSNGETRNIRFFLSNLSYRLRKIDEMIGKLHNRFEIGTDDTKIEGNQYITTIPLSPFDEEQIMVRATEGMVGVLALNYPAKGGQIVYIDLKQLPTNVNRAGHWTFDSDKNLRVVFPLKLENVNDSIPVPAATSLGSAVDLSITADTDLLDILENAFGPSFHSLRYENNTLLLTQHLDAFNEKDNLMVEFKNGFLMLQAVQNKPEGGEIIFHLGKNMPSNIVALEHWTFGEDKMLNITFSLKEKK